MSFVTRPSYVAGGNESTPPARLDRQGNQVYVDVFDQWIAEGRVFCSSDADGDDTVAAIATWVATTPQLLLDVPVGTTVKPLWVSANNLGTTAGTTGAYIIMYDSVDRYASGGTSETVTNMRADNPLGSNVALYSTPTAGAASAARTVFVQHYETDNGAATNAADNLDWTAKKNFSPLLVGPAAFIVWIEGDATSGFAWSVGWAEFPTADIT
jgi:hypothetical protein